jgi:hypothetical protein
MGDVSLRGMARWRTWPVVTGLLLALGSCRAIAGLHDVTYVAADGACGTPVLPTVGKGRVRLVNAGTQGGNVDSCIRVTGSSDWGNPILSAGPDACDTGLSYGQVTVPFNVQAGSVDVETIPAGSSCDPTGATSQALGVVIGDSTAGAPVVTLVRYGGGSNPESIAALPEEPPGSTTITLSGAYGLRLVNAVSSGQSINVGYASSPSLPATVATAILPQPILPGGVEPPASNVPSFQSVDAEGYAPLPPSTKLDFGVVIQGGTTAQFTFRTPGEEDIQTVFAIGDSGDKSHPIRGLQCEDSADAPGNTALLASCVLTTLPSLAVDTFNTGLYGADAPFNDERKQAVYDAIAARSSDLMCVVETSTDYKAIVASAAVNLPYSYYAVTDLDTQPTDPTDKQGNTPPPPTAPPCAGVDPSIVQSIYQCTALGCTNDTGGLNGYVSSITCLSGACAGDYTDLYFQSPQDDACVDCIIYYATSELPLSAGQTACTTDSRQPFAYQGMNGTLILSRYPLANTQSYILPSTGFRRSVLYAQVMLEDNQTVDFFCGQFISSLIDADIPYVGNYGTDIVGQENGWEDEQDLQAQRAVTWIQATAKHPAIIAGDWHSTAQVTEQDPEGGTTVVLDSQSVEVINLFDQSLGGAFTRAEPSPYQPVCEYCPAPQNVYNAGSGVRPEDFTPTFLKGFAPGATVEDSLWGQGNTVPLTSIPYEPAPNPPQGPISPYWGRLVRVLRPGTE